VRAGLGGDDFARVRVGVGRPDTTDPERVSAWVLGPFAEPPDAVERLVADAANVAEDVIVGRREL
jgi:PTH1 family peptidyl-tRNA hydrolase